ncbi:MAG: hypothetical protein IT453_21700 [Planctomycetes bacterium]|nr:hypothetical protein [Planctomycetota bacterium]
MRSLAPVVCVLLAACVSSPHGEAPPATGTDTVEVVPLQFASADELARILGDLELSSPPTRVLADQRTNSLVLQGPQEGISKALESIRALDVEKH